MAVPINIGLPPKGMMDKPNWLYRSDIYIKLELTPYIIETEKLSEAVSNLADNNIPFDSELGQEALAARADALGLELNTYTDFNHVNLYALQEGAISETYTNDISASTLTGTLYENLSNNALSTFFNTLNTNFGDKSATNLMSDLVNTIGRYLDPETSAKASEAIKKLGDANSGKKIGKVLEENQIFGKETNQILSAIGGSTIDILSGHRPIYPKLWNGSSTTTSYSFRVRLYNPNPASQKLHKICITNPLCILKALVMPSTIATKRDEKTGKVSYESTTSSTYYPPLYVGLKSKNLFNSPIGMIESMSVVYGGDENSVAFNGRPNYVDVSFSFKPLYQIKVISDKGQASKSNEYINMKELIGEKEKEKETVKEEGAEHGGKVTTPQNQSDVPTKHRGGTEAQLNAHNEITNNKTTVTETSELIQFSSETGMKYSYTVNGETRVSYGTVSDETLDWYYNSRTPKENFYSATHTNNRRIRDYLWLRPDVREYHNQLLLEESLQS